MDRAQNAARRLYARRRRIGTILVIGCFLAFIAASLIIGTLDSPWGWLIWLTFGLFFASCIAFLSLTRCPFCGKTIVVGSMNRKTCPHCKKQLIIPEATDKRSRALEKRSGRE